MTWDWEALKMVLQVVQLATTAGVGMWVWAMKKNQVTEDKMAAVAKELDGRLDKHSQRITKVETDCGHFPNHTDMGAVYDKIGGVAAKVDDLGGEMKGLRRQMDMIHQHLLNGRG
ncbi:MAG: hypothetical protein ABIJ95_13060 [Pseudomonadota bacterium]